MLAEMFYVPAPLPDIVSEQTPDYCFLYNAALDESGAVHYLCYETQRDFHSVPRTHAIVCFHSTTPGAVVLDLAQRYACFTYDDQGVCEQKGLFLLKNSPEINAQDPLHFFMSAPVGALEVVCASLELLKVSYHDASAQQALTRYLQNT
jgi:hypothetical protein